MTKKALDEKIMSLNLMDDCIMSVALNHIPTVEYLLCIFLDQDQLTVKSVRVQDEISQVQARRAILDVHVVDEDGDHYNIEIHNSSHDVLHKVIYYGSSLDVSLAKTGDRHIDLPRVAVIFLCRKDILGFGEVFYHLHIVDRKTNQAVDMGKDYYILNAEVVEKDNRKSDVMQYFVDSDPKNMQIGPLSKRVHDLKIGEEQNTMREYMYDWEREAVEEAYEKGQQRIIID